ncbi:hypothetical protein C8R46DRAFT_1341650 [Mycena filopes]|nr:hypothetical protein C8R46DRAFT_1341650 [Mycena filopes]
MTIRTAIRTHPSTWCPIYSRDFEDVLPSYDSPERIQSHISDAKDLLWIRAPLIQLPSPDVNLTCVDEASPRREHLLSSQTASPQTRRLPFKFMHRNSERAGWGDGAWRESSFTAHATAATPPPGPGSSIRSSLSSAQSSHPRRSSASSAQSSHPRRTFPLPLAIDTPYPFPVPIPPSALTTPAPSLGSDARLPRPPPGRGAPVVDYSPTRFGEAYMKSKDRVPQGELLGLAGHGCGVPEANVKVKKRRGRGFSLASLRGKRAPEPARPFHPAVCFDWY